MHPPAGMLPYPLRPLMPPPTERGDRLWRIQGGVGWCATYDLSSHQTIGLSPVPSIMRSSSGALQRTLPNSDLFFGPIPTPIT